MVNKDQVVGNIFNSISDVFISMDLKGRCLLATPAVFDMTGYSSNEIMGRSLVDFIVSPGIKDIITQTLESDSSESIEIEIKRKEGSIISVSSKIKVFHGLDNVPIGLEGIFRDITKEKKAESEQNKLFNRSFDLLCVAGFDGYFKELNPAWEKVLGYSRRELKAKPFLEFIHLDDRKKSVNEIDRLKNGGRTFNFENRFVKKNGSILHLAWTATTIVSERVMYCIARDISEYKRSEEKIREYQQRLRDLTHELIISEEIVRKQIAVDLHDHVGQILASSRMQLSRLSDFEEDTEKKARIESISKLLREASQSTRAVIFDLSPPELEQLGLIAAVMEWAKEHVERKHGIKIKFHGIQEWIVMDEKTRFLLFRNIRELLSNVVKHARADQVTISFWPDGDSLEIEVEDNGIGFEFHPDFFRKRRKTFGLFSVQERIIGLQGILEIDSVLGKGTKIKMSVTL